MFFYLHRNIDLVYLKISCLNNKFNGPGLYIKAPRKEYKVISESIAKIVSQ